MHGRCYSVVCFDKFTHAALPSLLLTEELFYFSYSIDFICYIYCNTFVTFIWKFILNCRVLLSAIYVTFRSKLFLYGNVVVSFLHGVEDNALIYMDGQTV